MTGFVQMRKGEPMEWIVEAESLSDFIDHGRYTLSTKPLIRCKDCKHFGTDKYKKLTWCGRKDYGYGWGKNDFCSRAEMRGNENVHP